MAKWTIHTKSKNSELIFDEFPLREMHKYLSKKSLYRNVCVVVDENVWEHWRKEIFLGLQPYSAKLHCVIVPSGENSKSFSMLQKILSEFQTNEFGRDSLVVAIGGGVTGDLAGFAASIYTRGVKLVQVPSTLLAMVDSSIGGKTGINFQKKKNIIGTFYQPDVIFADSNLLKTLPVEELKSGYGEIIKYAFLSDDKLHNTVAKYNFPAKLKLNADFKKLVQECMKIKTSVVEQDEHEGGLRKILNLGHTFAHAFESELNFKIMHGEAVAFGIISALYLSKALNLIDDEKLAEYLKIPLKLSYSAKLHKMNMSRVLKYMRSDKKNANAKPRFVLITGVGELALDVEASDELVEKAIRSALARIKK
jgi:3-dehydroquinate synthase